MTHVDVELSKRLETAEGRACVEFAEARSRLFPNSGACWTPCAGAHLVFDGSDSPITQTFGLGLFEPLSASTLDTVERFFLERGAPVFHEVSPFAGAAALDLLCARRYRPVEISSVLYQSVKDAPAEGDARIRVRVVGPEEMAVWTDVSARGWTSDHPELLEFFREFGIVSAARRGSVYFLAEFEGKAGAAGVLCLHDGVALFGGASTVPELRRRGLQSALLRERMRYAFDHGCDLAMVAAESGSKSQRNAERSGFRIAYTRMKWRLTAAL